MSAQVIVFTSMVDILFMTGAALARREATPSVSAHRRSKEGLRTLNELEQLIHDLSNRMAVISSFADAAHTEARDRTVRADLLEIKKQADMACQMILSLKKHDWARIHAAVVTMRGDVGGPAKI